ncbi:MAG: hypothetical protein ACFB2W_18040 [Leptolyngbyaceae cyanobacterium]
MTPKEMILQELETAPELILAEVLDFLRFLKAKRAQSGKQITVVSPSGEMTVPLGILAAQEPSIAKYITATPTPIQQIRDELKQALERAGYDSREKIVGLVQEVKQEMLAEEDSESADYA